MTTTNIKTPGVYIDEKNAFPNSVVPIATAVPAFIGYTPRADYQGKSYIMKPQKITSFAEFQAFYSFEDPGAPMDPVKQYKPQFYLEPSDTKPENVDYMMIGDKYISILPDQNTIYYMYNSIRLFYENGGGDAYIVSVGGYGAPSGAGLASGEPLINHNVILDDLKKGLAQLENEEEPTIYICPEATLLSVDENGSLMQAMLIQCNEMQTAVSILDVIGGRAPNPLTYKDDIVAFRTHTGTTGTKYGISYYPFVGTTIMQAQDIDYTNLFGGDLKRLADVLQPEAGSDLETIFANIEKDSPHLEVSQYNAALLNASKIYGTILKHVLKDSNVLPPSGGMAGIYTMIDNQKGVWHAPANLSMASVAHLPIRLSANQQAGLNVDAVSGKSINAIRFFNGQGILVWGARTLDGNSLDWKYIPVRRTMTFLEQSVKIAAQAYVFEPNDANTWVGVKSMIESFLNSVWKQGGLQGAKAADAFTVEIGLGTTMTPEDILNGFMNVKVSVAVVHPAEFIVITFQQQMAKSG